MVALRRVAVLLIMLTLAVISSGLAQAQTGLVTCTATAVPPVVRAEGIAELVGDIVLTCLPTIGAPAQPSFQTNISVALNVNVTNNIDFGAGENITDAVLVINENNCTTPSATGSVITPCDNALFQDPQFGRLADVNRLEWDEVLFPFPGAETAPASGIFYPSITTVRVTSVRANASQLGVPDQATFPSTQITAFVSITGPTTIPITNNVLNVAVPILGLIVTLDEDAPITGLQCLDTEGHTFINLKEGFATSFKTLGVATFLRGQTQWESGYYAPGSNNGGGASQPTRFLIRFFNIPEGLTVEVPKYINHGLEVVTEDALAIRLVSGADANGAGGTATSATDNQTVSISGGFGSVTYEVEDADPFRIEDLMFGYGLVGKPTPLTIHRQWAAARSRRPSLRSAR
jgi:hypothetical protein